MKKYWNLKSYLPQSNIIIKQQCKKKGSINVQNSIYEIAKKENIHKFDI